MNRAGLIAVLFVGWLVATPAVSSSHGDRPTQSISEVVDPWSEDRAAGDERRAIDWPHWGLALYLDSVEQTGGKTRLDFALELRPGVDSAWTSVGYPRYRTRSGRWQEAVVEGLPGSRVISAATQGPTRGSFSVQVSDDVQSLRLALGGEIVELEIPQLAATARATPLRRAPPIRPSSGTHAAPAVRSPGQPVRLEISLVEQSGKPFGDGAIDAGETGLLAVEIANLGSRDATGVNLELDPPDLAQLDYPDAVEVPTIPAGGRRIVEVPIRAAPGLTDAVLRWTLRAREPFGHDSPPLEIELAARAAEAPRLVLTDDFVVEGEGIPVPRDSIVTVRLRVRNLGHGTAEAVRATLTPSADVYAAGDTEHGFELGSLAPGEVAELSYRCYANQRAEQLGIHVELSHATSRAAPSRSLLALPLEEGSAVARIVRVEADPKVPSPSLDPPPPPLTSDVDRAVPRSLSARPDALAVVLGVERYAAAPAASFSAEDARTAARYFEHALGIPPQRIQLLVDEDVTLGQLHRIFGPDGWISRRMTEETEVFVFFAGHGVSAGAGFAPYLVPADGDLNYIQQTGFQLDLLIEWLLALDGRSITVFLDTCFSGLTREGEGLFEAARPLVVTPSRRQPSGLSLYSAARGTQLASGYDEQGHGLFSYFLFKGLAGGADLDADGVVLAGELKRYLEREVALAAMELDREQDPSVFVQDPNQVLIERR